MSSALIQLESSREAFGDLNVGAWVRRDDRFALISQDILGGPDRGRGAGRDATEKLLTKLEGNLASLLASLRRASADIQSAESPAG